MSVPTAHEKGGGSPLPNPARNVSFNFKSPFCNHSDRGGGESDMITILDEKMRNQQKVFVCV